MNVRPQETRARRKLAAEYWLMKFIDDHKEDLPKLTKSQAYEIIRDEAEKEGHVFTTNRIRIALQSFNILFSSKSKPQGKSKETKMQIELIVECLDMIDSKLWELADNMGIETTFRDDFLSSIRKLKDTI